jgi:dTDP-4-amino-4,6-dideoxy-D-galactose acyltransferase
VRSEERAEPGRILDWDSAFWAITVARVAAESLTPGRWVEIDAWARDGLVECLYFLAPADDHESVAVAQAAGFRFVDLRLELSRRRAAVEPGTHVRAYRSADLDALRTIARTSHEITRFYADPRFPRTRCADLYDTWIYRSCEEGWADAVLVAALDGDAAGYVTCHLDESSGRGSIGLIAVSAAARGKGLGRELVDGALAWMDDRGCRDASVVTQGANVAAQRLFQMCGFRTSSAALWFHRWYDG